MDEPMRWTWQTRSLLAALAVRASDWRHGYDLSRETGLKSGTLYPLLMRLERRGWLETRWEAAPTPGRPARHLYRLTGEGRAVAAEAAPAPAKGAKLAWRPAS